MKDEKRVELENGCYRIDILPFVLMFFIKFPNLTLDLDLIKGITQQLQNKKQDGKEED
jgi:hypothetical protein